MNPVQVERTPIQTRKELVPYLQAIEEGQRVWIAVSETLVSEEEERLILKAGGAIMVTSKGDTLRIVIDSTPDTAPSILTTQDVAQQLGVAEKTVRRWLRSRKLRGSKTGKTWKIPKDALRAFLDSKQK